jgi:type IV secretion system protein TrbG
MKTTTRLPLATTLLALAVVGIPDLSTAQARPARVRARTTQSEALAAITAAFAPVDTARQVLSSADTSSPPDSAHPEEGFGGDPIDAATREYRLRGLARTVAQGNFVAFPYGHSEPVLTCTVLRACIIELESGETLANEPIAGDQVRWLITGARAGIAGRTTLVVIKPKDCDITTNLIIPTDRRIYDLTLDSPPCKGRTRNPQQPFVRHVRFYYPDEEASHFLRGAGGELSASNNAPGAVQPDRLNFDYGVKKDRRFPWAPAQVFDDGAHVFIKLPPEARSTVIPVLFVLGDDGVRTILNYTIRDGLYVTDRTFRRGVLVISDGGKERRVQLENRAFAKGGRT